ncbi:MAG: PfkB family carbohydrate kinase [Acidobacteriaceae bacterium]
MPHVAPVFASTIYRQRVVVGLGEILWDCVGHQRRLGGAPANFAVMAARLGDHGVLASRVGVDDDGKQALDVLAELPLDLNYLQTDAEHRTGQAHVVFDRNKDAHYEFPSPAAWEFLDFSPHWCNLASEADAVCYGTLAQRHPRARKTIHAFLAATPQDCLRVFDVNLRQTTLDPAILRDSLAAATLVKLNEHEAARILPMLRATQRSPDRHEAAHSSPDQPNLTQIAHRLLREFPSLKMVCITLGGEGSLLVTRRASHRHKGIAGDVVDTVGAGDAFTGALVHYYLDGAPLPVLNEAGNRWGAWVASQRGAVPPLDAAILAANANAIAKATD